MKDTVTTVPALVCAKYSSMSIVASALQCKHQPSCSKKNHAIQNSYSTLKDFCITCVYLQVHLKELPSFVGVDPDAYKQHN